MVNRLLGRRNFIAATAGAAAAWPFAARAQRKVPRLGVLLHSSPQGDPNLAAARRALQDLGYVEGRTLTIDYRYAEGRAERLPAVALELVGLKPDVVFSLGGDVSVAAVRATRTIPVVFTSSADPVQLGFVQSLARPGGNATGVTFLLDELASKRLELLKEAVPHVSQVAFLWNPDHIDNEPRVAERAASALGVQLQRLALHRPGDIEGALRAAADARAQALYVVSSRLTVLHLAAFTDFARTQRLPLAGGWGAWARAGGLLSYGPNLEVMTRRAVGYVDRILKGAKPAELPVEQPTKFELAINLKTAKALGLEIPLSMLARADEVIE
jgi:putative tryptophan/tyrosine transport system substrate-binding protein